MNFTKIILIATLIFSTNAIASTTSERLIMGKITTTSVLIGSYFESCPAGSNDLTLSIIKSFALNKNYPLETAERQLQDVLKECQKRHEMLKIQKEVEEITKDIK